MNQKVLLSLIFVLANPSVTSSFIFQFSGFTHSAVCTAAIGGLSIEMISEDGVSSG